MFQFDSGEILLLDKPLGWSSFDVVRSVRRAAGGAKVGHAGTLDPLATGLMLLCTGKWTRHLGRMGDYDKTYTGTLRLGITTPCYDLELPPDAHYPTGHITDEAVRAVARQLTGPQMQVPPVFSAIKVEGKRSYKAARRGSADSPLPPRAVDIYALRVVSVDLPDVHFEVHCSKGTYIRSLAHDWGRLLHSGAVLTALRRTAIGAYRVDHAMAPAYFKALVETK
jgi:tRNA pseudouridine55 synthase